MLKIADGFCHGSPAMFGKQGNGNIPDDRHDDGGVLCADCTFVFLKHDILDPVQPVLNVPVFPDVCTKLCGIIRWQAADPESGLLPGSPLSGAAPIDDNHGSDHPPVRSQRRRAKGSDLPSGRGSG